MEDATRTEAQRTTEPAAVRQQMATGAAAAHQHQKRQWRALHQVWAAAWEIRSAEDIPRLLEAVRAGLEPLEIPFQYCGLNVLDMCDPPSLRVYVSGPPGSAPQVKEWLVADVESAAEVVVQMWRSRVPAYRRDLEAEDGYNEGNHVAGLYGPVRSVLDIPYSHGTLVFASPRAHAFAEQNVAFLATLADVLSAGFQQLEQHQDLARAEARYQRLVETPDFVVMLVNPQGLYVYVSPQMENWLGYAPEAFYADPDLAWRLVHPGDREKLQRSLDSALQGAAVQNLECRWQHQSGEHRWACESLFPLYESEPDEQLNRPSMLQVVVQDICERKRAEEVLKEAHDELDVQVRERTAELTRVVEELQSEIAERQRAEAEKARLEDQLRQSQKMQAIGQLTGGIAHNFNNMLTGVLGNVQLALMGPPGMRALYLKEAESVALRGAAMIKQLLVFSHRGDPAEQSPVQINAILHDVVDICRKTFDRKIGIDLNTPPSSPTVLGHASHLEQVFLNLCLNARDALEDIADRLPSVDIAVDTFHDNPDDGVRDPQAQPGLYTRIRVTDNGRGMDKETQERILEPFFTTKEAGKGTGLGLATVYAIVEQHSGWIEVESQLGTGTTVSVCLPVTASESPPELPPEEEAVRGGTETILVIEDEEPVRRFVAALLKLYGYTVMLDVDGKDGWATFQRARDQIDLVLLDLRLPHLSGEETLAHILVIEPGAKVVVATGVPAGDVEADGARAVLYKPYRADKVLRTVRAVLDE